MQENPFSLKGKTILVTGASSGIGRSIAIECSKMGATVILNGRNEERLASTLSGMAGKDHLVLPADLTLGDDILSLVEKVPTLDGVVHSAGVGHRLPCKLIAGQDVDEVLGINFKSPVLLQAALLKCKKIKKSSSIVFIASRAAESPSVGNALYSASKGALISYAKCLSLELAPRLIRVNCICPAMVWTGLILQGGLSKEYLEQEQKKYPLGRYGKPEDISGLAVYLLSDLSLWMTGSCIDITGGGE